MAKVSVIIPARNERFLVPTIIDALTKAEDEVEVIAVLDGYMPPELPHHARFKVVQFPVARGMRAAINAGVALATGDYLLKADAHCLFGEGYDRLLAQECAADWVVVPRRKRLDAEHWCVQDVGKPDIDYMYLSYPNDPNDFGGPGLNGRVWDERNKDLRLRSIEIDDLMTAQGSAWFMPRPYFERLELLDEAQYGSFANEFQEIGLKCWLSGGRVIVNKRTWYAHLHKGKTFGRGYFLSERTVRQGAAQTRQWFTFKAAWDKQTLPLQWLIEKFWPVPTWPPDWKIAWPEF